MLLLLQEVAATLWATVVGVAWAIIVPNPRKVFSRTRQRR